MNELRDGIFGMPAFGVLEVNGLVKISVIIWRAVSEGFRASNSHAIGGGCSGVTQSLELPESWQALNEVQLTMPTACARTSHP